MEMPIVASALTETGLFQVTDNFASEKSKC
jgi:hypothetical protein